MKRLEGLIFVWILAGCALMDVNDDLLNNKYLDAAPVAAPDASYVGTWTASGGGGLISIRINPDGTGRYCENWLNGTVKRIGAKIYKTATKDLYLITETGTRFKIKKYSKTEIKTTAYGEKYKFIPGVQSINCKEFIG